MVPHTALKDRSGRSADRRQPAQQKEVMAAQSAAVGPQDPVDRLLQGVANAHASKINRFAVRTSHGKHSLLVSFLTVGFRRAAGTLYVAPHYGRRRSQILIGAATTPSGAAGFARSLDLFRRPEVRLGELYPLSFAGNLTLVSLG